MADVLVPFWPSFWPALVAGLVATVIGGALLLAIGYRLVDRRLHLQDRADRAAEEEKRERSLREPALQIACDELQFVAGRLKTYAKAVVEDNVPYPRFDTNGWTLVSQASVVATLQPATTNALTLAYNRVRSVNEQFDDFTDLTLGQTAALVHVSVATGADENGKLPPLLQEAYEQYQQRRADLRRSLPQRLKEMEEHIHTAIDAVEAELGTALAVPSAQRRYIGPPVADNTKPAENEV